MSVYTLGVWTVKRGCEEEFIQAWLDLATRTQSDFPGGSATLLRDRDNPRRFISLGPWQSLEQIEAWRASTTFKDGVGRIRGLLDSFEPHTMDEAVVIS
ncbi:MAG: antibiotic biosynthesis monooxygenase family protein [Pseudonocardiaceae bacterium]